MALTRRPFTHTRLFAASPLLALFLVATSQTSAGEWPQWLGPNRDGVFDEPNLIRSFPDEGPPVVWRTEIGAGYSGPAVADGRVVVMDRQLANPDEKADAQRIQAIGGSERVLCFDSETGKQLWVHEYDCEYKISYPSGPRTTATIEGEFVYCLGAMGDLVCLRMADGKPVWTCDFMERFEFERPPAWGWAASPLILGDQLLCVVGGKQAGVVAFDKMTGETTWKSIDAKEMGYASPVVYDHANQQQLIVWYDVGVSGLDPDTGKVLWQVDFPDGGPVMRPAVTISHPRLHTDNSGQTHVIVSDFYHGTAVLKIMNDPPDAEVVWTTPKGTGTNKESLNTLMAAPYVTDGHIFGFAGNGELKCVTLDKGDVVWRKFGPNGKRPAMFATTFIIPNHDHKFLFNDQGMLIIAKISVDGYEELSRANILETTSFARGRDVVWSHPAFANGRMFARNDKELVCIDLSKPSGS